MTPTVSLSHLHLPILEKKGAIPKLIADMVKTIQASTKPPIITLVVPWLEETVFLQSFVSKICQQLDATSKNEMESGADELRAVQSLREAKALDGHQGPVLVHVPTIVNRDCVEWMNVQNQLLHHHQARFTLLVTGQELPVLVKQNNCSHEFVLNVRRTFIWPNYTERSPSVKRDYFIHFVGEENPSLSEALRDNGVARDVLRNTLSRMSPELTWVHLLREYALRFASVPNRCTSADPVESLDLFLHDLTRSQKDVNAA